jgi:hypothetical protein
LESSLKKANNGIPIEPHFPPSLVPLVEQLIFEFASLSPARSFAEFNANNALALRKLRGAGKVRILKFDDALLKAL